MPGLPFGAAQTYSVPDEMRTYDHVVGLKFIEIDPDLPYPRSSAYRKVPGGAQMLLRDGNPEIDELELDEDAARELVAALSDEGMFDWQRVYKPVQGNFVNVVIEWRVEAEFDAPIARRTTVYKAEGAGEFPDSYDAVVTLLLRSRARGLDG